MDSILTAPVAAPALQMLEAESSLGDAVLQAARAALPSDCHRWYADGGRWYAGVSERQRPLIPLLVALLDATDAVASALEDNAWEDGVPLSGGVCGVLARTASDVSARIAGAAAACKTSVEGF